MAKGFGMVDIPREVVYKIYSKLDIDSRRAIGIYTKLKLPPGLVDKITRSFILCKMPEDATSVNEKALVNLQFPYFDDDIKDFYANMMYNDMLEMPLQSKRRRVMNVLLSWFESFTFEYPGVKIMAGIPDGSESLIIDYRKLDEDEASFILYGVNQTTFDIL